MQTEVIVTLSFGFCFIFLSFMPDCGVGVGVGLLQRVLLGKQSNSRKKWFTYSLYSADFKYYILKLTMSWVLSEMEKKKGYSPSPPTHLRVLIYRPFHFLMNKQPRELSSPCLRGSGNISSHLEGMRKLF